MKAESRPLLLTENYYRYPACGKILLIAHILVSREQEIEAGLFRCDQQIAIAKHIPALLSRCADCVALKVWTDRDWRCLIEENEHLGCVCGGSIETAHGEFDDCFDLLAVESVEPFHDVVDIGACFDVLEDRGDRHTGALEDPRAAKFAGDALYCGAL
jgi:hypothetical protein